MINKMKLDNSLYLPFNTNSTTINKKIFEKKNFNNI